jgi:hypothetical protein
LDTYGNRVDYGHTICLGDEKCFQKAKRAKSGSAATTSNTKEARKRRKAQRSLEFRQDFIREEIPRRLSPDDDLTRKLSLTALILSSYRAKDAFATQHEIPIEERYDGDRIFLSKILALEPD